MTTPSVVEQTTMPFQAFPKLPRLSKVEAIVTEKLDGTNACVVVSPDGRVTAQSRNRIIAPGDDNYGFASWVAQHHDELLELGPGYHFGEWWGVGIQRGYGLHERRFSLFNTSRWSEPESRPACCHVVPVLYHGPFDTDAIEEVAAALQESGSIAAPGFDRPEGVVIFLTHLNSYLKLPFDPNPKGGNR